MKRRMTLKQLSDSIEKKKKELGYKENHYITPNSGKFRTKSKRALLQNIERKAMEKGMLPLFKANYIPLK